jgi:endopeptidase La
MNIINFSNQFTNNDDDNFIDIIDLLNDYGGDGGDDNGDDEGDNDDIQDNIITSDLETRKQAIEKLKEIYENNINNDNNTIIDKYEIEINKLEKLMTRYKKEKRQIKTIENIKHKIKEYKRIYEIMNNGNKGRKRFNLKNFIDKEEDEINKLSEEQLQNQFIFFIPLKRKERDDEEEPKNKRLKSSINKDFYDLYNKELHDIPVIKYYNNLDNRDKFYYLEKLKNIKGEVKQDKPNYIKILESKMSDNNKTLILQKITQLEGSPGNPSKLRNWISKIMKVNFDNYIEPPIRRNAQRNKIMKYLEDTRKTLDESIFGHETTKEQLIKIIAHTITNPKEGGNVFALQGPPGVGKTALIQNGISKVMKRPFSFISLGGATDACFLEGHDYTYEGSNHGRIVDVLQKAGCMNPVIYFDELDKVSETPKGQEIINVLMHITDTTQNTHFNDKYFGSIDFDLSKAIIIFSFNDESKISRILRDRMKIIKVKGYKLDEKIIIARDYLIPNLIKEIGLEDFDIKINDKIIEFIIERYTNEGGVRKIKEILKDILLEINIKRLEGKIKKIDITETDITDNFLRKKQKIEILKINEKPRIGIVNGLWANDYGMGGLIPIECCWIPTQNKLDLELTGMQGQVMKESMSVARTVAWRIIPDKIKEELNIKWKQIFDYGIHIHCPDGATPKDGPSAGGAITTCLISLLTGIQVNNKIAMTGEINLKGQITAIGGLEEKLFGAKKAGAELVLCPKENEQDLREILNKFSNLEDEKFKIRIIENIWEILELVLLEKIEYNRF